MRVRGATADDAQTMARNTAAVAEEDVLAVQPPVDVAERARRFAEVIAGERPGAFWVLECGGRVVGHAGTEPKVPGVFSIGMAILPEARGRGGGRMLLDTLIEHGRATGAHKIELEVWTDNGRAIALYAAAGFEVEGLKRDHYRRRDGSLRSALYMTRRLD